MSLRLRTLTERMRSSLFFVPTLSVVAAVICGLGSVAVDQQVGERAQDLPLGVSTTVDSARAVLTTIAGATITFAAIAFSISLLLIQQASSQYSPRVVHTLFRNPFNRRVMGLVLGTFTYCVIVLRSVRAALDDGGQPVIPSMSVSIAVVLGIITILAIVAFIDHSAHAMDVSEILEDIRSESIGHIRGAWAPAAPVASADEVDAAAGDPEATGADPHRGPPSVPPPNATAVVFDRAGWVQEIDEHALLAAVPAGATAWVEAYPGRYAIEGAPICHLSVAPADPVTAARHIRAALAIGPTRTMQQDVTYGLRQLSDVALRALSPAMNDPTTAQDALFHGAAVLAELLRRDPPAGVGSGAEGRTLVQRQQPTADDLVRLAFEEVRRSAADQPTVCVYLLEAIELVVGVLDAAGLHERTKPLVEQARLIVEGCSAAGNLPEDISMVRAAHAKRFGAAAMSAATDEELDGA